MFQSPKNLMRAMLDLVDEMLVGAPEADADLQPTPDAVVTAPYPHPHQRSVQLRRVRRDGATSPREAHCLSPVRSPTQRQRLIAAHPSSR